MINKQNLKKNQYYIGTCRNTNIAMWNGEMFIFINYFFANPYIETIPYYGDIKKLNTDGFIPTQEIIVNVNEILL